jgi:hypothetical protein
MAVALIALACCPPSARDYAQSGDVMRRFLLTVATAASVLAVTSCSDITGIGGDVVGTYELQTVNGQFLPATFDDPQFGTVTVEGGVVELNNNGTFVDIFQYRLPGSSQSTETSGTWTRVGNEIEFETDAGDFYTMTWTNGRLVQDTDAGFRYVYQR